MSGPLNEVLEAIRLAETVKEIKWALGSALTVEQQMGLSRAVANGPRSFTDWLRTDAGIAASRAYVDQFIDSQKTKTPTEVG